MKHLPFLFILLAQTAFATNYYVQSTGSNSNNGLTPNTPFQDIQTAADLTLPGDTVFVMNGIYSNEFTWQDVVNIRRSGTANAWIVYTNYANHTPKLEFDGWHGFKIEGTGSGVSYIEISGFEIEGNNSNISLNDALNQPGGCNDLNGSPDGFYNGNGIATDGRFEGQNHHIRILDCKIYNCGGNGISAIHSDYITIENCEVYNNAWYSIYGTSGISFYQLWNFDNSNTTRNIIRNNRIYGNRMFVLWIDAPCAITDGNGIIIDDSKNTQNGSTLGVYTGTTLIENNIVYENGGRGIHVFESDKVTILNNTTYANGQSPEISDGEITAIFSDDVKVYNNILYAKSGERLNSVSGSSNVTYDYNLNFNSNSYDQLGSNSLIGQDPLFVNLANRNFRLSFNSPAVDAGTATAGCYALKDFSCKNRPLGAGVDMGAYEYGIDFGSCQTIDLIVDDVPIEDGTYRAATTIRSKGQIPSGSSVQFQAGESIILQVDFEAKNDFHAQIVPCPNVSNVGISDLGKSLVTMTSVSTLQLFPNPARQDVTVNFQMTRSGQLMIRIFDTQGRQRHLEQSFYEVGKHQANLPIRSLPKGIYWVQLQRKNGEFDIARLIVE
ncbi:MAG: right-handed parallel beta-helix repeat-containing protein [Bacteroidota bacterium]